MRKMIILCWFLTAALAVAAGYHYIRDRASPERQQQPSFSLFIEEPDRDLGERPRKTIVVKFRVRNVSSEPIQVFGLGGG